MNILCIGNSFSQDACAYLSRIAEEDGVEITAINMMIGGCSLYTHFKNLHTEQDAYYLEVNGTYSNFRVNLKEAILAQEWDLITVQQVSTQSVNYDSFQPYLNEIVSAVRKYYPKAKLAVHETWAYEEGSARLNALGYEKRVDMYNDLHNSYQKAATEIGADFIIPSGTLFQKMIENGINNIHRDTTHASLNHGRYALGLLWYKLITGNSVLNNTFDKYIGEITDSEKDIIKKCVEEFTR